MGARTNFHFKTDTGIVTLYSHWGGDTKTIDLAKALNAAMPRISMGDTSYALRITISQLIGDSWNSEIGYGIFVGDEAGEEEYDPITVNFINNTVEEVDGTHSISDYINYHLPSDTLVGASSAEVGVTSR
jgi:hypothetical protein